MVVSTDTTDVIFVVEQTAQSGAYMNDLKTNYIIPTLEYFSQNLLDERLSNTNYGVVTYTAAQGLAPTVNTFGPFTNAKQVLNTIESIDYTGGKSESNACLSEGLATALVCFKDLEEARKSYGNVVNKFCVLICNSPPYLMHVMECFAYEHKNTEQLATIFQEQNINLSIISPRKIPIFFKLFEKAGGEASATTKNYCKDIRHLVLLKGFTLSERSASPSSTPQPNVQLPTPNPPQETPAAIQTTPQQQVQPQSCAQEANMTQQQQPQQPQQTPQMMNPMGQQTFRSQMTQQNTTPQGQMTQQQPSQGTMQANPTPLQMRPTGMQNQPMANMAMAPNAAAQMQNIMQARAQLQQQVANQQRWARPPQFMNQPQVQQMSGPQQMQAQNFPQGQQGNQANMANMMQQSSALRMQLMNQPNQNPNQQMPQIQNQVQNPQVQQQQQQNQAPQMAPQVQVQGQPGQQNPQQIAGPAGGQVQQQRPPQQAIRKNIWSGIVEWYEKTNKNDQTKVTRQAPFTVTANVKNGETEIKADHWPQRLLMQLMPKHMVGSAGGQYLKESKTVIFIPQQCEALESLIKVMGSGMAGCVHFTTANVPQCEIKLLILLYTAEKKAFLGFIPNDQAAFVERLKKVIMQNKQQTIQQGAQGQPMAGGAANPQQNPQMGMVPGPSQQQTQMGGQPQMGGNPNQMNMQQMNMISQNQMTGNPQGQMMGDMQWQNQQQASMMGQGQMAGNPGMMGGNQMGQMGQQMNPQMQQRMMRPQMSQIPNNPGLRHLLQQQQQPMRMQQPQQRPFDEQNFPDFM